MEAEWERASGRFEGRVPWMLEGRRPFGSFDGERLGLGEA